MLDRDEVVRSLTGAWRLFLDRPDAPRFFDVSLDGFWRSFAAILLILPAYVLTAWSERVSILTDSIADDGFSDAGFIFEKALALSLDWIALPVILALLAQRLGITRTYAGFVVARNWCAVLAVAPFGAIALLFLVGFLSEELANFLSLAVLIVVLRYNFIVARRMLAVSNGFAGGIVALDFVVSLTIAIGIHALLGAQ